MTDEVLRVLDDLKSQVGVLPAESKLARNILSYQVKKDGEKHLLVTAEQEILLREGADVFGSHDFARSLVLMNYPTMPFKIDSPLFQKVEEMFGLFQRRYQQCEQHLQDWNPQCAQTLLELKKSDPDLWLRRELIEGHEDYHYSKTGVGKGGYDLDCQGSWMILHLTKRAGQKVRVRAEESDYRHNPRDISVEEFQGRIEELLRNAPLSLQMREQLALPEMKLPLKGGDMAKGA